MGIFFDITRILGVRLLQLQQDAWYLVKEHIGSDYQTVLQTEFQTYVGNPGYRIEYAHPASTTYSPADEKSMLIWSAATS
jgi:hypothetical protein